jgi:hypothetical protein
MIDNEMLGLREIYNCVIKATYDTEVNGKFIAAGEPIVVLDAIQMADFQEMKTRTEARGGYNNQGRVMWENTKEVQVNFTQGVFSRLHFALLGNSEINTVDIIEAPKEEFRLEVNEDLQVELQQIPSGNLYIYDSETGLPIISFTQTDNVLTFTDVEPFTFIDVFYDFIVDRQESTIITVGRQLFGGYLTLTAKTRLKDDMTGKTVTGIFRIPRFKLVSDFSIRLGNDVPPSIGNFRVSAIPTGSKGSETVMDFIVLKDDIDSDM